MQSNKKNGRKSLFINKILGRGAKANEKGTLNKAQGRQCDPPRRRSNKGQEYRHKEQGSRTSLRAERSNKQQEVLSVFLF